MGLGDVLALGKDFVHVESVVKAGNWRLASRRQSRGAGILKSSSCCGSDSAEES